MIPSKYVLGKRIALWGVISGFLLTGVALAQSDPPKSANPAKHPAPAARRVTTPPMARVSIEEALQQTKKAPKDPNAYLALGGAYRRAGRTQEAVDAFKKVIVFDPNGSTGHVSLGAAYMDLKRPDDAEREFRKALKLNSNDPAAHFNMGNFYLSKGRRDDALSEFRRATELQPPIADAWVSLSLVQAELGKTDEATQGYKKALAIDSTNVRALTNLANAEYAQGKIPEATTLYRKALKYDPRNQEANYNMGVAFADAQIFKQALSYWKYVVEVDSTTNIAESAKSSIQILEDFLSQQSKASQPPPTGAIQKQ